MKIHKMEVINIHMEHADANMEVNVVDEPFVPNSFEFQVYFLHLFMFLSAIIYVCKIILIYLVLLIRLTLKYLVFLLRWNILRDE